MTLVTGTTNETFTLEPLASRIESICAESLGPEWDHQNEFWQDLLDLKKFAAHLLTEAPTRWIPSSVNDLTRAFNMLHSAGFRLYRMTSDTEIQDAVKGLHWHLKRIRSTLTPSVLPPYEPESRPLRRSSSFQDGGGGERGAANRASPLAGKQERTMCAAPVFLGPKDPPPCAQDLLRERRERDEARVFERTRKFKEAA